MLRKSLYTLFILAVFLIPANSFASESFDLTSSVTNALAPDSISTSIKILVFMTLVSLAPAFILMTTAFTRIVIVLSFVRQAIGTQTMPPNQVIITLAIFLTFFVMAPTWKQINDAALTPYINGEITHEEALDKGYKPVQEFMLTQTSEDDISLMLEMSNSELVETPNDLPGHVLAPAFMLSELKKAFQIGFIIYIPFLVIDMVVASVLLGIGMMMLPPPIISLPFKILLFVMVDGWGLLAGTLVKSFG